MRRTSTLLAAAAALAFATTASAQTVNVTPYAWQFPVVTSTNALDMAARLQEEVQKVLDAGRLTPQRAYYADLGNDEHYFQYVQPGRIVTTLAWAYPYLTGPQQSSVRAVLDCTGGWFTEQEWRGVPLSALGLRQGASIEVVSTTGYRRRFPAHEAGTLLLATHASGRPLSPGHGGPARIVAPGRRGFWWVKWVASIEVVDEPWWWQPPFPLQ